MSATAGRQGSDRQAVISLINSVRWFCRSIELCDDHLRGYYGLKIVSCFSPYVYECQRRIHSADYTMLCVVDYQSLALP